MLIPTTILAAAVLPAVTVVSPMLPPPSEIDFKGNASCEASGCSAFAESGQHSGGSSGGAPRPDDGGTATLSAEDPCVEMDRAEPGWTCVASTRSGPGGGGETVSPREAAEQARASMSLPAPTLASSPAEDSVVHFPVWLWVDGADWEPVSATASVSAGSVTVTAVPQQLRWDMGDGTVLYCDGPGTAFDPARHDAETPSPDCGHAYTRTSRNQPDNRFPVAATVSWTVEWTTSAGGGGTLDPLTTSASDSVRVREVHALVTDG
ncbi:hypothetical protein [Nocardiopsis alborubida]|nr:hypothetical protein [Nocardiopsis alborubida]